VAVLLLSWVTDTTLTIFCRNGAGSKRCEGLALQLNFAADADARAGINAGIMMSIIIIIIMLPIKP
jgi:hypothetical protein